MAEPIGALRAVLSATSAAFQQDMGRARKAVRREGSLMQRTFGGLRDSTSRFTRSIFNMRNAAVTAAGAAGLGLLIRRAVEGADQIAKTARQIGLTGEELQEFRFAAERSGMSAQEFDRSMESFTRRLGQARRGTGQAQRALDQLGLSMEDLAGKSPAEALEVVADRLQLIQDPLERNAILADLFGRSGLNMANLLSQGSAEMNRLRETARSLGIVMSDDLLAKAELANDQLGDMQKVIGVGLNRAMLAFMPLIGEFSRIITDPEFVEGMDSFGRGMADGLRKAAPLIRASLEAVSSAVDTFTSLPGWLQATGILGAILFGKIRVMMIGAVIVNEVIKKLTDGVDLIRTLGETADEITRALGIEGAAEPAAVDTEGLRRAAHNLDAVADGLNGIDPAGAAAARSARDMTASLADQNEELDRLIATLRDAPETYAAVREEIEILNQAKSQDIDLTTEQGQAWLEAAKRNRELSAALRTVELLYAQTRTAAELYAKEIEMLNGLLRDGLISQDLYNRALDQARERFEAIDPAARAAKDAADLFAQTSFHALSDMIQRGDDAIDAMRRLAASIADAALQAALLGRGPLAGIFGTAGSGGLLGGIFSGLFGALPGFRRGGSFEVRGIGGPDSQLTAIRTTPGEVVHVERKEDRRRGSPDDGEPPIRVGPVVIQTPNPESFRRSRGQIAADLSRAVDAARRFR